MKPYFEEDGITIYHTRAEEWLDAVPECFAVDLVLTDPPYGVGENYASFEDTPENVQNELTFTRQINRSYDSQFAKTGAKIGAVLNVRLPVRFQEIAAKRLSQKVFQF